MNATVKWHQKLTFTGTADTGFSVPLGGSPKVGGDNDGFRPMELIATGLAGCTAMDTISILQKKREEITNFEVSVHAERASEHPRVFTHIKINYQVTGLSLDEEAVRRAIWLSAERYCPAQAMLGQGVPMDLEYEIFEAGENGERKLVIRGEVRKDAR